MPVHKDFKNIQKQWEGKRLVSHIRILLSQTRMSTLKTGKIAPIIKKFLALKKKVL